MAGASLPDRPEAGRCKGLCLGAARGEVVVGPAAGRSGDSWADLWDRPLACGTGLRPVIAGTSLPDRPEAGPTRPPKTKKPRETRGFRHCHLTAYWVGAPVPYTRPFHSTRLSPRTALSTAMSSAPSAPIG